MLVTAVACAALASARKNLLFFAVDDLRSELGCYGDAHMSTPNMDKLANRSLIAMRNYCQQAVCGPTRASIMTGRRPDRTRVYDLTSYWRLIAGNYTTIPEYFKDQGYYTVGMGKVFHDGPASGGNTIWGGDDKCCSWTNQTFYYHPSDLDNWRSPTGGWNGGRSWFAVPEATQQQHPLPDQQTADYAVETLKTMPQVLGEGKNFFMAVGFHKPHLPFVFPERYLDLYPTSSVHLPSNQYPPKNMPQIAWSNWGELRAYHDIAALNYSGEPSEKPLPNADVLALRRGYYAAVSWTDACVGRVLDALEASPYSKNTIVSLWGDHGWQLGEHNEWAKHTNFDLATRAPLLVSVPGLTDSGFKTYEYTSHVDLFPTLVDAAVGVTLERCPDGDASFSVALCTEGRSLVPLMTNPTPTAPSWAFSQYPRAFTNFSEVEKFEDFPVSSCVLPGKHCTMGYTVVGQFEREGSLYRYTEWCDFNTVNALHVDSSNCYMPELYNHTADPDENVNIAGWDTSAEVIKMVKPILHDYMHGKW